MSQTMTDAIADFVTELARQEVVEKSVQSYRSDLAHVARWFEGSTSVRFESRDPKDNRHRYYDLRWRSTLFGKGGWCGCGGGVASRRRRA